MANRFMVVIELFVIVKADYCETNGSFCCSKTNYIACCTIYYALESSIPDPDVDKEDEKETSVLVSK